MYLKTKYGKFTAGILASVIVAGLTLHGHAYAGGPLPGKLDEVHKAFNQSAKDIGSDIRMMLVNCDEDACSYALTGKLVAMAYSEEENTKELQDLALIYSKGADATSMIMSMGILMIVYSPDSDRDERGAALSRLSSALQGGADDPTVILGNVKYTMSNLFSMGLWFRVEGR